MVVGLQGSGKTTFVAKLGVFLGKRRRKALLAAGDIHRPAAIDQLVMLGKSASLPVFAPGSIDPVRIATDAVSEAKRYGLDTVILDTAGRLHVDEGMMRELDAVKRAANPSEILFVADGMTGQDAVKSAQAFSQRVDFDGIVLTKMDGDSRGGAALSIRSVTGKPIKFITTSEKLDGLESFHPDRMASRILGMGDVVTLVERAQEAVGREQAERIAEKLKQRDFTFDDFLDQLRRIRKMGPLSQIMELIPGAGRRLSNTEVDEKALTKVEAIIQSMTRLERRNPHMINGSRRKRIAAGSGTQVQDVNRLLRDFQAMQNMMKTLGRMGGKKRTMPGFPMGI
jgi:signal recognition particle subunit SRP54